MSTVGQNTGIFGDTWSLEYKVRLGLRLCKQNSGLSCGNCPYVYLKDADNRDVSKCTSALAGDAEELLDSIYKNTLRFY